MTKKLVTLDIASEHLRRDQADDNATLDIYVEAASASIMNYVYGTVWDADFVDSSGEIAEDSNGDPEGVPAPFQQATLIMIGIFYRDRDAENFAGPTGRGLARLGDMSLPQVVHWLLDPYRVPRVV